MIICGVDEAGRGPVIGPLVLAGFCIEEKDLLKLKNLGVRDSKLLTPKRRKFLFGKLSKLAVRYKIEQVGPKEIDTRLNSGYNLNRLEALKCAKIIDELHPDVVHVDSPTSPKAEKFADMIKSNLKFKDVKIIAEHGADVKHLDVGAASIMAKVTRDLEVEKIEGKINQIIGSGYPSDEITQKFLKEHWVDASKYIRKSWQTFKNLKDEKEQTNLKAFE